MLGRRNLRGAAVYRRPSRPRNENQEKKRVPRLQLCEIDKIAKSQLYSLTTRRAGPTLTLSTNKRDRETDRVGETTLRLQRKKSWKSWK